MIKQTTSCIEKLNFQTTIKFFNKKTMIGFKEIELQLKKYFNQEATLKDLKNWTFEIIMGDEGELENADNTIKDIIFLIDDDTISEKETKEYLKNIYEIIKKKTLPKR